MSLSSGRKLLRYVGSLALNGTGVGYWMRLEAEQLEVVRLQVAIKGLMQPVRLLQLSDFHASRAVRYDYLRRAIATGLAEKPDLICFTGDLTTEGVKDWTALIEVLAPLAAHAPTFAVPGNHDGTPGANDGLFNKTRDCFRAAGIALLENTLQRVPLKQDILQIVGTGDLWRGDFRPAEAFLKAREELPTILLTHNPDALGAVEAFSWSLCLCGHTHGGQINLPGMHGRFTPIEDMRFVAGSFPLDGRTLHVNRGIGSIGGVRYNARPEITVFDLVPVA